MLQMKGRESMKDSSEMNERLKSVIEAIESEFQKEGFYFKKMEAPIGESLEFIQKVQRRESIPITMYFASDPMGRSLEEIETSLRILRVKIPLYLSSCVNAALIDLLDIKLKYKLIK